MPAEMRLPPLERRRHVIMISSGRKVSIKQKSYFMEFQKVMTEQGGLLPLSCSLH